MINVKMVTTAIQKASLDLDDRVSNVNAVEMLIQTRLESATGQLANVSSVLIIPPDQVAKSVYLITTATLLPYRRDSANLVPAIFLAW